jgi:hypothetical protein
LAARGKAGCGDHRYAAGDQVGEQAWQALIVTLQPVVLDGDVVAFVVAGITQAFAEPGSVSRQRLGGATVNEGDHWHLLRAPHERPRRRAAE